MVPHVHGAVGVGDHSDGYAEGRWLPAAGDIPAEYAAQGTWYDFFQAKEFAEYGMAWDPGAGAATFVYPNKNRARPSGTMTIPWA